MEYLKGRKVFSPRVQLIAKGKPVEGSCQALPNPVIKVNITSTNLISSMWLHYDAIEEAQHHVGGILAQNAYAPFKPGETTDIPKWKAIPRNLWPVLSKTIQVMTHKEKGENEKVLQIGGNQMDPGTGEPWSPLWDPGWDPGTEKGH